jgi:ABC-2 type transport system permease protein
MTTYDDHLLPPPPPPPPPPPAGEAIGSDPKRPSVFFTLCDLMMRTQVTRTRVLSLMGLGALGLVVGWAYGSGTARDQVARGTDFVNLYGLSLLIPVATLVLASSMFGDPTDDNTLVYLWLRPVARFKLVLSAALISFVVTWPIVVPPLVVAAALTKAGRDLALGTLLAGTVTVFAYTGIFIALGIRVKRPLVWGLLYIFIWEGFVARAGPTAAKLAVRAYGSSILSHLTDSKVVLGEIGFVPALIVPLVVGVVALAYAVWRLRHQDVA